MIVEIFTDGACKGNPGPGGWGVFMRFGGHEKELWGGAKDVTNNQMELQAAIEGLKILKRPSQVILTTDSQYVRKGVLEWMKNWKKNNWKTAAKKPVKNKEFWQELDSLQAIHEIEWKWVKGHSGHPENEKADDLANRGVEELRM